MTAIMADTAFALEQQDTMEISSEQTDIDGDFEIDFDAQAATEYQDEDEMKDDPAPHEFDGDIELRSVTEGDQQMSDDASDLATRPEEDGFMADEPNTVQYDEELLDLSDEEETLHEAKEQASGGPEAVFDDNYGQEPAHEAADNQINGHPEQVHSADVKNDPTAQRVDLSVEAAHGAVEEASPVDGTIEAGGQPSIKQDADTTTIPVAADHPDVRGDADDAQSLVSDTHELDVDAAGTNLPNLVDDIEHDQLKENLSKEATNRSSEAGEDAEKEVPLSRAPESNDEGHSPSHRSPEAQPTLTGLHPTVVKYDGGQYLLFPPSEASADDEYLLQDENLVNRSINDLLKAVRTMLDTAITYHDDLELHVEELELYICEDSETAHSISLSELLDLYLQLHAHDGVEAPPAMIMSLSSRSRFAERWNVLTSAAIQGRGFLTLSIADEQDVGSTRLDQTHQKGLSENEIDNELAPQQDQSAPQVYSGTEAADIQDGVQTGEEAEEDAEKDSNDPAVSGEEASASVQDEERENTEGLPYTDGDHRVAVSPGDALFEAAGHVDIVGKVPGEPKSGSANSASISSPSQEQEGQHLDEQPSPPNAANAVTAATPVAASRGVDLEAGDELDEIDYDDDDVAEHGLDGVPPSDDTPNDSPRTTTKRRLDVAEDETIESKRSRQTQDSD